MRKVSLIIKLVIKIWLLSLFMNILLGGFSYSKHTSIALGPISLGDSINFSQYTPVVGGTATIPVQNIDEVEISFVSGDITVLPYDGTDFKIDYRGDSVDCLYEVDGNTLHICPALEHFNVNIGFSFGTEQQDGDVTLYVPQTLTNLEVDAETVSGDVDISIVGHELSVQTVSGDIDSLATFHSIEMDTVSGDMTVTSTPDYPLTQLECQSVSGNLSLSGAFNYRLNMESLSGDHRGNSSNAGNLVDISFESVSGDFNCK